MFKQINYDSKIVIGTPLVPWKVFKNEHNQWLRNKNNIKEKFKNVIFFVALEIDNNGISSYGDFINELNENNIVYWTYMINDNCKTVDYNNRWIRIETGRNLIREYAQRLFDQDAILYVDSDIVLTVELLEKLLEIDHPIVSVDVPAYCLNGKVINENPRIEEHWNTAGCLLVNYPYFYDLPWYHNSQKGLSDDPTFQHLAERLYSQTWVRKDIFASHEGQLIAIEDRGIGDRNYG